MKMKQILAILLALTLCMSLLAACGSETASEALPSAPVEESNTQPPVAETQAPIPEAVASNVDAPEAKWYSEGRIYSDFVSVGPGMSTDTSLIFNNDVSVFYSEAAQLPVTETSGQSVIDGFVILPMPVTLREE